MRLSSSHSLQFRHLSPKTLRRRSSAGSVLPFVAVSMLVIAAYLGFSVDLTRNLVSVRKAEFAADSAALYAYSLQTNADGSYTESSALDNMVAALSEPNGSGPRSSSAWNDAPSGPASDSGPWNSGVTFSADDMSVVSNPVDSNEKFLRLRVRREGPDALRQIFLPAIYATNSPGTGAARNMTVDTDKLVEVVGEPASRIGAGVPSSESNGDPMAGVACFPLALSNSQFAAAAAATTGPVQYTIDLATAGTVADPTLPQHIKAAFINDARINSGIGGSYLGNAKSNQDINQLVALLKYFNRQSDVSSLPPAAIERGVTVQAFDTSTSAFKARRQSVLTALAQVTPGKYAVFPVIATNPSFGVAGNRIVGFARMRISKLVTSQHGAPTDFSIVLDIGNSIVMRNATANQVAVVPLITGTQEAGRTTLLPSPEGPFQSRTYDPSDNSLSRLPRGLVLAPTISPRSVRN